MSNENEELKVVDKEESITDSKKIDLYINNNNDNVEQGISIMRIFGNLKERFHIFIYIILITLILGLLIPYMMYSFKSKNEASIAVLGLDYEGAEQGLAPDGSSLDISYIKSSYIIQNALSSVKLSKDVSVALVQSNISITGILTDETKEKQEILDKLLAEKSTEYAKMLQTFSLEYRAQYIITLKNDFNNNGKVVTLPSSDLQHLLNAIINSYAEYFNDTYLNDALPDNYLGAIDTEALDYLDILDEIQSSLNYLEEYCETSATYVEGFRASDGLSFSDLASVIRTVKISDIDYIYSYVYLNINNVSKNPYLALNNYKYQKREATLQLNEVNENITITKNSIAGYQPDKVVISSTDNNQLKEVEVTSNYYNELVVRLTSLNNQKSALEEKIAILDNRINKLETAPATGAQIDTAEEYVSKALSKATSVYDLVSSHSEELYNSNAYKNSYMHAITTTESDTITNYMKTFVIGAAAGLFIGIAVWFVDAFVIELKAVRKEQEMKEGLR